MRFYEVSREPRSRVSDCEDEDEDDDENDNSSASPGDPRPLRLSARFQTADHRSNGTDLTW